MYVHTDKVLHLNVRCLDYIYNTQGDSIYKGESTYM